MNQVIDYDRCTGCEACVNVCPRNAITMKYDKTGFLYPTIDEELCINCLKCKKTCPIHKSPKISHGTRSYMYQNRNKSIRFDSTSGGFFSELAEIILSNGGYVCGAGYNNDMILSHLICSDKKELFKLRKSKYVQSKIGSIYKSIEKLLKNNKKVLFVGTPCQVAGMRNYFEYQYSNLILIDLVCYGVPSPGVFHNWINYLNDKYKGTVDNVIFRDKTYGYATSNIKVSFKDGRSLESCRDSNVYSNLFFKNLITRSACFSCQFKTIERTSDITLGDLWLVGEYDKALDDNLGTTAVFAHNDRAKKICENLCVKEIELNNVINMDARKLVECATLSPKMQEFWCDYEKLSFKDLIDKYEPLTLKYRFKLLLKKILNKLGLSKTIYRYLKFNKVKKYNRS